MMEFAWPDVLFLLLLIPALIVLYAWGIRRRKPSGIRYSSLSLIREAAPGSSRVRRHLPAVLLIAAVGAITVAMARPTAIVAVPTNQTTVILAIDVSGSMCSSDIPPSRLQAAEDAASNFIKSQATSTRIGIVAFSGFAEIVQAPTDDRPALLSALQTLATGRRTAIGEGILASIDAIADIDPAVAKSQSETSSGTPVTPVPKGAYSPDIVVLLTDGASNTGADPIDSAQQAADRGVRVFTIGFGTAGGGSLDPTCAPQFQGREPNGGGGFGPGGGGGGFGGGGGGFRRGIDEDTLKKIADMTGAKYYPAESADQLESVFSGLPMNLITKNEAMEVSVVFVGLGTALAGLALLLGKAWRPYP